MSVRLLKNVKEMCIEANYYLSDDMKNALQTAVRTEESPLGRQILEQLQENLEIAATDMIPICQDTGMAVVIFRDWTRGTSDRGKSGRGCQ